MGIIKHKIYARKCIVKKIDIKSCCDFLNTNHIQGKDRSSVKLGLYYNDVLVSVMTFNKLEGRKSMGSGSFNLSRFCNKIDYVVLGGASKLFKFFLLQNDNVDRIVSYADNDWSVGGLYEELGFVGVGKPTPDYKYVIGCIRKHKQNFTKTKLGTDMKEHLFMRNAGFFRIWDCGKLKYEFFNR